MDRQQLIVELINDSMTLGNLSSQIAREVASVSVSDGERHAILNKTLDVTTALIENMRSKIRLAGKGEKNG